ncbi:phosphate signaling complex protein PhoU [Ruminococcaceae bacterium OttesenSCG-928-I18]|nr:phosphate signaling complex protein PhoU [Ruminococcaceae bacterium OttesenSCG-928-I18]
MRSKFDSEMEKLHTMMIEMGALCESGIASAVKALTEYSEENAKRAIALEEEVNRRERDIEQLCYTLLLRQQPVARDLRMVSASIKMITDMERIGDQAADIAEIALMGHIKTSDSMDVIRKMAAACIGMVTDCIDAYVKHDTGLALKVIADDDIVDSLFNKAKQELTLQLVTLTGQGECVVDLLMVAKYLERIADHAVNIADWVIFIETNERYPKGAHRDNLSG